MDSDLFVHFYNIDGLLAFMMEREEIAITFL